MEVRPPVPLMCRRSPRRASVLQQEEGQRQEMILEPNTVSGVKAGEIAAQAQQDTQETVNALRVHNAKLVGKVLSLQSVKKVRNARRCPPYGNFYYTSISDLARLFL